MIQSRLFILPLPPHGFLEVFEREEDGRKRIDLEWSPDEGRQTTICLPLVRGRALAQAILRDDIAGYLATIDELGRRAKGSGEAWRAKREKRARAARREARRSR